MYQGCELRKEHLLAELVAFRESILKLTCDISRKCVRAATDIGTELRCVQTDFKSTIARHRETYGYSLQSILESVGDEFPKRNLYGTIEVRVCLCCFRIVCYFAFL